MKIIKGFTYSFEPFDSYKYRARVVVCTAKDKHNFHIYTTNPNRESFETDLLDACSSSVVSIEVMNWVTKEEDDAATALLGLV